MTRKIVTFNIILLASILLFCCTTTPKKNDRLTNLMIEYSDACVDRCVTERDMTEQECYQLWKSNFTKMTTFTDKKTSREGGNQLTALCDKETWDFLDKYKAYLKSKKK